METKESKKYKSFKEVVKESNFFNALEYKFLEMRDRFPLVNKLLTYGIITRTDSTQYNGSFIAYRDSEGKLDRFEPRPVYPNSFHEF